MRMSACEIGEVAADTLRRLRNPFLMICSIVGFANLADYTGMSLVLGSALTVSGHALTPCSAACRGPTRTTWGRTRS